VTPSSANIASNSVPGPPAAGAAAISGAGAANAAPPSVHADICVPATGVIVIVFGIAKHGPHTPPDRTAGPNTLTQSHAGGVSPMTWLTAGASQLLEFVASMTNGPPKLKRVSTQPDNGPAGFRQQHTPW
jgi:hypothetical protein